jgi:porin
MKQFPVVGVGLILCGAAQAQDTAVAREPTYSLATTSALLRFPGSPFDALRRYGVSIEGSITSVYQGGLSGSGDKRWQLGGKGDLFVTIDGEKAALWSGFFVNFHQEWNFGRDANRTGAGLLLPINTVTGLPRLGGYEQDTAITITQRFGDMLSVSVGKFNMLDLAARTPIMGGGGLETFSHIGIAAPVSGVTPPYIVGAIATLKTEPAIFTLMIYDPRNAQDPGVVRRPFRDGTTWSLSVTVPTLLGSLPGFYGVRAAYSSKEGVDLNNLPALLLPNQSGTFLQKRGYSYGSFAFQQYLYSSPDKPGNGWGLFADLGISEGNPNAIRWHAVAGIGGTGVLGRQLDRWGVAYFKYGLSDDLKDGLASLGIRRRDEQGLEAYYNMAFTPWLRVTANLQWITPTNPARQDAVFAGLRSQLKF